MEKLGEGFQIIDHRLLDIEGKSIRFEKAENLGGRLNPKYLVMHYTAGTTTAGTVAWLTGKESQASAHIIIGKDGEVVQLADFNRIAFHAGYSYWEGFRQLNSHSIGIELVNAGRLKWGGKNWIGGGKRGFKEKDIVQATHKFDKQEYSWELFPEAQLSQAILVARKLIDIYNLVDVVGHDDISPLRKWDPGPAFPMDSFRSKVMGRKIDSPIILITKGALKLQSQPKPVSEVVTTELLPDGMHVELLDRIMDWTYVILLETHAGQDGLMGWLPSRQLVRDFSSASTGKADIEDKKLLKPDS